MHPAGSSTPCPKWAKDVQSWLPSVPTVNTVSESVSISAQEVEPLAKALKDILGLKVDIATSLQYRAPQPGVIGVVLSSGTQPSSLLQSEFPDIVPLHKLTPYCACA